MNDSTLVNNMPNRSATSSGTLHNRANGTRPQDSTRLTKGQIERGGKTLTGICVGIVLITLASLIVMVTAKGLSTFISDGISPIAFLTGQVWDPHTLDASGLPTVGALPMIVGSFAVTLLSCAIVIPFAVGSAIYAVEVNPRFGRRFFRPALELLVGIPSVVFGLVGLTILVPLIRNISGGTGYGILAGSLVLAVMVLPTVTSLVIDALESVPAPYRQSSAALGGTRWQTIWHIVLRSATPGILTAVVLGMARAFGEALAVQMVIGNAPAMPTSLTQPASTLTSILTMNMGNEAMNTVYNDVLWSLALILLVMSLIFILIVHFIGRKSEVKHD